MKIILIGGFSEMFELCEECGYEILGYTDNQQIDKASPYSKYSYLGTDNDFNYEEYRKIASFVVTPDSPAARERVFNFLKKHSLDYASIVSPDCKISNSADIALGTVIQFGAHVSAQCKLGSFVKINVYGNVMHNSVIGDFSTIAPNTAIMGRVEIGKRCYIGAHATVLPNVFIADDITVGAGAVVTKNLDVQGKYAGVPARRIG